MGKRGKHQESSVEGLISVSHQMQGHSQVCTDLPGVGGGNGLGDGSGLGEGEGEGEGCTKREE